MAGTTTPEPKENGFEEPAEHEFEELEGSGDETSSSESSTSESSSSESNDSESETSQTVDFDEVSVDEVENNVTQTEDDVTQTEDDVTQTEDEVTQGEDSEQFVAEAESDEGSETHADDAEPTGTDQVDAEPIDEAFVPVKAPRNQGISPAPIPVLDRPPANPNADVSVSSINAIYEDETQSPSDATDVDPEATNVIERVDTALANSIDEAHQGPETVLLPAVNALDHENQALARDGLPSGPNLDGAQTPGPRVPANSQNSGQNVVGAGASGRTPDEPFAGFDEEKSGRGWVKGLIGTTIAVIIAGGAYTGAQYYFADKIAKDVDVAGVSIAGLTEKEAAAKLDAELSDKLDAEMTLAADDLQTEVVPSELGFALDSTRTVAGLTGFTWDPVDLWEHLTGDADVDPVLTVDSEKFAAGIAPVESALYVEPINGTVSFVDGAAVATEAVDGVGVSLDDASNLISTHVFSDVRPVVVEPQPIAPDVTQEATDTGLAAAKKIASAAVTVEVDDQKAEIPQEAFTQDIEVTYEDGTVGFVFNGKKLSKEVLKRTNDLVRETQDAYFTFSGGKPSIVPEVKGTALDADTLAQDFATAAQSDNRAFTAELVETEPEDTTKTLKKLGVKEIVASFSTPITNDYLRTENLRVAAKRVTGTLVKPGEQFNLYQVIGPIDASNGYHNAGVIVNGKHTDGMGGGLSQMSTTTYNAGFFAGMTDIAHRPHTVWIPRYPEGRESTLYVGSIDMIWQNDSDKGVLMRSYVANGKLTVEAWGTKTYKVTTSTSARSNVSPATMTTSTADDCEPYPVGQPGFSVTVFRKVTEIATGSVVKDESNSWTYRPDNGVTCEKPEDKKDKKDD